MEIKITKREEFPANEKGDLPEKLWQLIEVALEDVEKVEKTENMSIDMFDWCDLRSYDGVEHCKVCFAGAVMINTLGHEITNIISPSSFLDWDARRLRALDELRAYEIGSAIQILYGDLFADSIDISFNRYSDTVYYEQDSEIFKSNMRDIAEALRELDI